MGLALALRPPFERLEKGRGSRLSVGPCPVPEPRVWKIEFTYIVNELSTEPFLEPIKPGEMVVRIAVGLLRNPAEVIPGAS